MTPYLQQRRPELLTAYRDGLLQDVIPFWLKHGMDRTNGGIYTALGRHGELLDSDKSVWFQGRAAWTFANLYNTVEPRPEWLEAALSCGNFLHDRCPDLTGKLHFTVTAEGDPLRMRRYVFSECFAAIAYGALFHATGQAQWKERAIVAFDLFLKFNREPGHIAPKTSPETRPMKGLSPLMMTLVTAQDMRADLGDIFVRGKTLTQWAAEAIAEIRADFVKPDLKAVMEVVGPNGEIYDHFDGRLLNPGHSIEAAWFILREARHLGDESMQRLGLDMLDWMWARGWDREHGGLVYGYAPDGTVCDSDKYFWVQAESFASAWRLWRATNDSRYLQQYQDTWDWAWRHLVDHTHGAWYRIVDAHGQKLENTKSPAGKVDYHTMGACWDVLRVGGLQA